MLPVNLTAHPTANYTELAMRGLFAFLALLAIFEISPSAAQEMTEPQRDIYQTALRVDGWLTEDMHKEFWAAVPKSVRSNAQAWTSRLEAATRTAFHFQSETWKSARLSIQAKTPVKTASYESTKQETLREMAKISSSPNIRAQVEVGARHADEIIIAAATGKPFTSTRGPLYVTEELIENMLTGLKGSQHRLAQLINPVWTAQLQNQERRETKFSNFEEIVRAVNAFDQQDRKAIVLMVRGIIKENFDRTLANALRTSGKDQAWALRTVGMSVASMMNLANETGWPEMGMYYETELTNLVAYTNRTISPESYAEASKKNQAPLKAAISGYQTDAFRARMLKHKPLADSIGSYVVGTSKLAAHKSMTKQ